MSFLGKLSNLRHGNAVLGGVASFLPPKLSIDENRIEPAFRRSDIRLLESVLCMQEYGAVDKYSPVPPQTLRAFENRFGAQFSRCWLVSKMALRRHAKYNQALNALQRAVMRPSDGQFMRGLGTLYLKLAAAGQYSFQTVALDGDILFVGNNTNCENTAGFKWLVTPGQWRCVVILIRSEDKEGFTHYAPSPASEPAIWGWIEDWISGLGQAEATIISAQPEQYAEHLQNLRADIHCRVFPKDKSIEFDLAMDKNRRFYRVNSAESLNDFPSESEISFAEG